MSVVPFRKPQRQTAHCKLFVGYNLPDLLPVVKQEIATRWRAGVTIRSLAAEYRLTVAQVEAVVWEPVRDLGPKTPAALYLVRKAA